MNKYLRSVAWLITTMLGMDVFAQQTVPSSEILHNIKGLKNCGKVLYIAAHPDDENTRLISHLTQYEHFDVSYLSLTRGDGGQNLIGTEIGEQLGLIRTHELLEARKIDGGHQYFSRAIDFGYSKTPEETFKFWNKEEVLSDVVWVIRQVRPDFIITRFSPKLEEGRSTHGHHTASAMLAVEAFRAAADPKKFPEQLEHVDVWQPQLLCWNTSYWFYGSVEKMEAKVAEEPSKYIKVNVNQNLPLIGKSGSDISSASRSQHKSQGFGNSPVLDEQWEYLELLEGETNDNRGAGIPAQWTKLRLGSKIDNMIDRVSEKFDPSHPEASLEQLFEIRKSIAQIRNEEIRNRKLKELNTIIVQCLGIKVTAFCKEQKLYGGQLVKTTLEVSSASEVSLISVLNQVNSKEYLDSAVAVKPFTALDIEWMAPNRVDQPYWLQGEREQGLYVVENQRLRGLPVAEYPYELSIKLQVGEEEVLLQVPLMHGSTDPVKGQIIQLLMITPDMMLNLDREVYIFSSDESESVSVEVISGKPNMSGYVELILPEGWKSEPAFFGSDFTTPGEVRLYTFEVTPPEGQSEGSIRAIFKTNEKIYSRGIHQLKYDHIPETAMFPGTESKVVRLDLKINGSKIGYVMGAGDKVPQSTEELGYTVEQLTVEDILQKDLSDYQAIVIGIRALNTIEDIGSINERLLTYVKNGGNVVMQYNTSHRLKSEPLGPYEIKLSRDRVTEEDAAIKILDPDHVVLNKPNKITQEDFDDWVQERGLYFPNEWSEEFSPILSMHDQGEEPQKGSLLVAEYEEGHIVYTGISFFRELPAGVSGAYRLWANILSL